VKLTNLAYGDQRAHDLIDRSLGDPDSRRAIRRLHRALSYGRESIQALKAYKDLGERYERLGNLRRAVWYYTKALELAEDDAITRCWRGQGHYRLGNWAEARADLEAVLQSGDLHPCYHRQERDTAQQYLAAMDAASKSGDAE
jgi:tetratricopeptide (TPR) repeat protein